MGFEKAKVMVLMSVFINLHFSYTSPSSIFFHCCLTLNIAEGVSRRVH